MAGALTANHYNYFTLGTSINYGPKVPYYPEPETFPTVDPLPTLADALDIVLNAGGDTIEPTLVYLLAGR